MWIYHQSTGVLQHEDKRVAIGYSGHGEGCNSHSHESIPNIGPLPVGLYTIGKSFGHPNKGPMCMRLFPVGHDAHGRSGFMIHGDNSKCNKSASEGCIILGRTIRDMISKSLDRTLKVII